MISKTLLYFQRLTRQLWLRVVLISLCSVLALALAPLLTPMLPEGLSNRFGRDAVLPILTILASGMLAVTTFSLNVMVSAYRTASSMSTPRVYRLLLEDTVTQSVLATFVGGFVYSLCAIILFRAKVYAPESAIVVFAMTIFVVALIVIAILRWIDHLSGLGSMDHTLRLIETRSRTSLKQLAKRPCLGGKPADSDEQPEDALPIPARRSGFVRFADMARLNEIAAEAGAHITMHRAPGDFVLRGRPVAWAEGGDENLCKEAAKAIEIGDVRSFDQDPVFGLALLAETAQKALSPGVNDPGTAIEVMGRLERLLWETLPEDPTEDDCMFEHVSMVPVSPKLLLDSSFAPIAHCGKEDPFVMKWMQQALTALSSHPNRELANSATDMGKELKAKP
jgi:uncharacterized membrane protein